MHSNESRARFLHRSAGEVKRYRRAMQVIKGVVSVLLVAVAITYVAAALYSHTGSFTVGINKFEFDEYGLSLSESRDFNKPTSQLTARPNDSVINISAQDIPKDVDMIDGSHNGDNYLAYTFYLKNAGAMTLTYEFHVHIANVTNDVDKAVRIRVYTNGQAVDYARTASDGSGAEPGTTQFLNATSVCRNQVSGFSPGQMTKYTIVIWVEGDDPDCVDYLIGGSIKVGATMSVIPTDENND